VYARIGGTRDRASSRRAVHAHCESPFVRTNLPRQQKHVTVAASAEAFQPALLNAPILQRVRPKLGTGPGPLRIMRPGAVEGILAGRSAA